MLKEEIINIYSALSILLVFITILMSKNIEKADLILSDNPKVGKPKELDKQLKKVNKFILNEWLSSIGINALMIWLLTPTAIKVIFSSTFSFFKFDITLSIFILIYFTSIYFFLEYVLYTMKLLIYRRKLKST